MNSKLRSGRLIFGVCCLVLLQAGWALPVWSQQTDPRVTIAVLDFALNMAIANADESDLDERPATMALDRMRAQVASHKGYVLVETRLAPSALTEWPCTSDTCAVDAGERLGVQQVIRGQVLKVSALIWFVSARLIDVKAAKVIRVETLQFRGNMTEVIPRLMTILWRRMNEPE